MINKKFFNFSNIEIFLVISYLISWFSISTSFQDILNIAEKENQNFNNTINFFRQFFNLLIFPVLLIIFSKEYKNIKFKNELLFIFALLYFLLQIPGLFLTNNLPINIIYIISALNILFIFILTNIYFNKKKYLIFFYITFSMLCLITILNYKTFSNFFFSDSLSSLYTFFFANENFLGKDSPRSTGSSRTLLVLMITSFLLFHKYLEKNNFLKLIIYVLISTFILLFQSRTTITLLIVFVLMNFIYEKNYSFMNTIKYLFQYVILPIIFLYFILIIKESSYPYDFHKFLIQEGVSKSMIEITKDFQRPLDPNTFSSGRVNDWKALLSNIDKSIIYGFGAQGDRFLINQTASNGILYAISSSGILGVMPFILFSIFSLWVIFKQFLKNYKFFIPVSFFCSMIILLMLLRSILETSYAVFSVDFIIVYTFINYLNKFSFNNDTN